MSTLYTVFTIAQVAALIWHGAYFFLRSVTIGHVSSDETRDPPMVELRKNMWWVEIHVALPYLVFWQLVSGDGEFLDWLSIGIHIALWLFFRSDDHDDRWKRRRKKVAAKAKAKARQIAVKLPVPALPVPA